MVEAVRTTASPGAIWAIVAVAVVLLASWLTAIMLADRYQVRTSGRNRVPGAAELAVSDAVTAENAPGRQATAGTAHEPIGARGQHARDGSVRDGSVRDGPVRDGPVRDGDVPTRADVPAQSAGPEARPAGPAPTRAQPAGRHAMPAQRSGDADRAERSYAGPPPDEDEQGRPGPRR